MRGTLISTLIALAESDARVMLLTGDLGWSVLEPFAERFPKRFVNVGVAEQNMLGVATGLGLTGYIPYVYSIATFSSMRCYEQIRNGPLLHHLPVRIIGIGGGYAYGHNGPTHHAIEDLAIMRSQPGMTVVAPADAAQARTAILAVHSLPGPAYFRIGKAGSAPIPGLDGRFKFHRPEVVKSGRDVLVIATGEIAHEAVAAATAIEHEGLSFSLAIMAHLPFMANAPLVSLLRRYRTVITVEEAVIAGGLGSLVAEAIADHDIACSLIRLGTDRDFPPFSGTTEFMRREFGISAEDIATRVQQCSSVRRRKAG